MPKTSHVVILGVLAALAVAAGLNAGHGASQSPASRSAPATSNCDATLWNHVYHGGKATARKRLLVKQECIEVTGILVAASSTEADGCRHEPDGDAHCWLKPDPQFKKLLNKGNLTPAPAGEDGNLVLEIVCKYPVTQPDTMQEGVCNSYHSPVQIPPMGTHVKATGSYVQDTNHLKWMEIHPVTAIAKQ